MHVYALSGLERQAVVRSRRKLEPERDKIITIIIVIIVILLLIILIQIIVTAIVILQIQLVLIIVIVNATTVTLIIAIGNLSRSAQSSETRDVRQQLSSGGIRTNIVPPLML